MLALVDIGNSLTKILVLDGTDQSFPSGQDVIASSLKDYASLDILSSSMSPCTWIIASVDEHATKALLEQLQKKRPADTVRILRHADLPIELDVDEPAKVGMDRLCSAVAANHLKADDRPAIVVNSGTAVTVNAIDSKNVFVGGVIFPGLQTSFDSLNSQTAALPRISIEKLLQPKSVIGKNTRRAIQNGVILSHVAAVSELVELFSDELKGEPDIFVAGGHSFLLAVRDDRWHHVPDLVLQGIHIAATKLT